MSKYGLPTSRHNEYNDTNLNYAQTTRKKQDEVETVLDELWWAKNS